MINEHPIPFTDTMVRAILAGRKTQTRRVIPEKLQLCRTPEDEPEVFVDWCSYGHVGDRLWVKETYAEGPTGFFTYRANFDVSDGFGSDVVDLATGMTAPLKWKSSRFMPKRVARLWLEIVSVRVERLQEISNCDGVAEGCYETPGRTWGRLGFSQLWDSINAKRGYSWESNPWVWVLEFRRVP